MKQRLFVDMDGTLAEFHPVHSMEELHAKGYFAGLPPQQNVVEAVRILNADTDVEVYILSAVLSDSKYALQEKKEWLEKYLPEIDSGHFLFSNCGRDKAAVIPDGIRKGDTLIDDFTKNLLAWPEDGIGINLLNGINHSRGSWKGSRISMIEKPESMAKAIKRIMSGELIRQPAPLPPDPRSIICLDTETTGLDENAEILQLGICDGLGNPIFNHYFKPLHHEAWPEAENVNHISPEMVKDELPIEAYRETIEGIFAESRMLVGYNIEHYDLPVLRRAGIMIPDRRVYDVMTEFAPVYGAWGYRYGDYKWQSLETCANYYDYTGSGFHDASGDILTVDRIYLDDNPELWMILGQRTADNTGIYKGYLWLNQKTGDIELTEGNTQKVKRYSTGWEILKQAEETYPMEDIEC